MNSNEQTKVSRKQRMGTDSCVCSISRLYELLRKTCLGTEQRKCRRMLNIEMKRDIMHQGKKWYIKYNEIM